ncbi:hypothetical protein DAI22_11g195300 [Oryza sativa Japonica Group]|nr:hypothetical protein DAI22_11g195300 [Oryza sativa Japonica Group]
MAPAGRRWEAQKAVGPWWPHPRPGALNTLTPPSNSVSVSSAAAMEDDGFLARTVGLELIPTPSPLSFPPWASPPFPSPRPAHSLSPLKSAGRPHVPATCSTKCRAGRAACRDAPTPSAQSRVPPRAVPHCSAPHHDEIRSRSLLLALEASAHSGKTSSTPSFTRRGNAAAPSPHRRLLALELPQPCVHAKSMRRAHAPPRRRRPVPGCSEFTAFACSRSVAHSRASTPNVCAAFTPFGAAQTTAPSLLFLCFSHHGRRQCTQSTEPIDAPREPVSVVHTESKHRAHAATPIPPPKPPSPPSSSLSRPMSRRVEHASRTRASASLGRTPPPPSRHPPSRFLLSTSASTPRRRLCLRPAEPPPRSPPRRAERGSRGRRCRAGIRQARGALFHLAAFPHRRGSRGRCRRAGRASLSPARARARGKEKGNRRERGRNREKQKKRRETLSGGTYVYVCLPCTQALLVLKGCVPNHEERTQQLACTSIFQMD